MANTSSGGGGDCGHVLQTLFEAFLSSLNVKIKYTCIK